MSTVPTILGHTDALARFRDALRRDRLHHAWLLEGPRGVGKRTVAQWVALFANCETVAQDDTLDAPCGTCRTCRRILAGNHPDVQWVQEDPDKATPIISVQQIREVVRTAAYHRYDARRRVVIVDPADAMPAQGANALLKTLEEPPEGTYFFLVASHASSLLPTIVSRCQRLRLGPVPVDALAAWLAERDVEDPEGVARIAQGCPGRALALAEGDLETRSELRGRLLDVLGGDLEGIYTLSEAVTKGSRKDWLPRAEALLALLEELLRDTVVRGSEASQPLLHPDLGAVLDAWAEALWPGGVTRLERAIADTRRDLALNVSGRTTLDALLTRTATELGRARTAARRMGVAG